MLTVTDNAGAKATASTTVTVGNRYRSAWASSVLDYWDKGKRYYYPAITVGDYTVPVPSSTDQLKQWLSKTKLSLYSDGKLKTPVSLTVALWARKTVRQIKLNQASYPDGKSFHTKDFVVYARRSNSNWVQIGSGQMPNTKAALLTLNVTATEADEVSIQITSTWDTWNKGVGLSEVEVL